MIDESKILEKLDDIYDRQDDIYKRLILVNERLGNMEHTLKALKLGINASLKELSKIKKVLGDTEWVD